MSNNLLIVPSEKPSSLLMVPVTAVKEDLITKTDELIYVPIATKNTYGVVKIGEGLHILNGVLTIDPSGESLNTKVDKFQGIENEGKVLLVDEDGYVSLGYAEGSVDVFSNGVSAVDDAGILDFSSNFIISEENGKAKISLTGIPEKLSDLDLDLDIAYRLDIANHNTDPNSHLDIRGKLLEVEAVAKGRSQAISYDNYMYMINAFNTLPINEYSVGQSVYIGTLNVPDLWISKVEDTSETYAYSSDEAIIQLLKTNGNIRVGYYVLSPLETEKVDLTDYLTLDTIQTVSGIKTFTEQIGLLNAAEGEADFIKHINNNFLITSHDGKSLLNIDEQLEKIYSFNKELATKEYVDEQGGGGSSTPLYSTTGQNTDGAMTQKAVTDALNKRADKVIDATENNIVVFDNAGNVKDSGIGTDVFATKVLNATNNNLASLDADGNIKNSGLNAIALENSINSKQNNVIDSVGIIDWADFRPFESRNLPFDGFGGYLGTYACRLNTSDDTSGLISNLGFGATYYAEFNIWYIGAPNGDGIYQIGMIIKISDSSASTSMPYAEANVIISSQGGTNISSLFTKTRPNQAIKSEVNSLSMCPKASPIRIGGITTTVGNQNYQATANGYVMLNCQQGATGGNIGVYNSSKGYCGVMFYAQPYTNITVFCPVEKGDTVTFVKEQTLANIWWCQLIPAKEI